MPALQIREGSWSQWDRRGGEGLEFHGSGRSQSEGQPESLTVEGCRLPSWTGHGRNGDQRSDWGGSMKRQGARTVHVGRVLSQGGLQGPGEPPHAWLCVCREDGGIQCARFSKVKNRLCDRGNEKTRR